MALSWASIVRGKEVEVVKTPEPTRKAQKPQPLCTDCGELADICRSCGSDKLAVYEEGYCAVCLIEMTPSESMCGGYMNAAREANKIPFKCSPCRDKKPWSWADNKEIVKYKYQQSCFCHKLSKDNVIRSPIYRIVAEHTDPMQREKEAMAAFQKEMKFSGQLNEAVEIYRSFFTDIKAAGQRLSAIVEAN